MLPEPGQHPVFAQLYFYDTEHEADNLLYHLDKFDKDTVVSSQQMIQNENRLYGLFKQALNEESLANNTGGNNIEMPCQNVAMHILEQPELDNRRYNRPSSSKVTVILLTKIQVIVTLECCFVVEQFNPSQNYIQTIFLWPMYSSSQQAPQEVGILV